MTKPTVTDTRGRTGAGLRAGVGLDEVTGNSRDERGRDHVDARAWSDRADDLGRWVWVELITREDCYGCYYEKDGQVEVATAKRALTPEVVRGHFQARSANGLIGLHSTVRTTLEGETEESCWSRFGAIDVDAHCENDDPDANWRAAKAWFERARDLGLEPLLIDSHRKGGYHLWIVFESVATEEVYALLRWLVRDWRDHGLSGEPECFPKQREVAAGRYGNWLRLPGRHPKHGCYSRVWNGSEWLVGHAAIDAIVAMHGVSEDLIPAEALTFSPELPSSASKSRSKSPRR